MKNKMLRTIIFVILIISALFFLGILFLSSENQLVRDFKKIVPLEVKVILKKTIFYFPELINENNRLYSELNEFSNKYDMLASKKDFSNENFFPTTQYLNLDYKEVPITVKNSYPLIKYGVEVNSFYIESFDDHIIFAMKDGNFFYQTTESLIKGKFLPLPLKSNLPNEIEVTDIMINEDQIYISYARRDENNCNEDALRIDSAKINLNNLEFTKLFHQNPLKFDAPDPTICESFNPTGGVMELDIKNNKTYLIVSILDQESQNYFLPQSYDRDLTFKYATISRIDLDDKSIEIISSGHRNPHGLLSLGNGMILSTEHGPKGGDEINLIKQGKNYGWPFVSYGEPYKFKQNEYFTYKKDHKSEGFEEPIYAFLPSIGISRIIEIPNSFSNKWNNSFIIASLKKESLYRVRFDEKFEKVIYIERMRIGSRIRDLNYDGNSNTIFLALENDTGAIGMIRLEN